MWQALLCTELLCIGRNTSTKCQLCTGMLPRIIVQSGPMQATMPVCAKFLTLFVLSQDYSICYCIGQISVDGAGCTTT